MNNERAKWIRAWLDRLGLGQRSADFWRSARNALFSSGESLLVPVLWIVTAPLFVAKLGKDHFGIWMLVNGAIGMGGVLSFGLTDATIKFVSKYRAANDRTSIERVVRTSICFYPLLGIAAAVLVFGLAPWLGYHVFKVAEADRAVATAALRIGALGIVVRFLDNVFLSVLQGFERYDWNSKVTMAASVLIMGTNVGLACAGAGLSVLLGVTVLGLGGSALVKACVVGRGLLPGMRLMPRADWPMLREMLSYGVFSGVNSALAVAAGYGDRFLIISLLGPTALTYYTVCKQLVTQVHVLLSRAFGFLFPLASTMFESGDRPRLRRVYHQATFALVILTAAMIVPIFLWSGAILSVWMGADFAEAATDVLRVLCVRYAFLPLSIVNYYYLLGTGLVRVQALISCITLPLVLIGMLVLVPHYGLMGAACSELFVLPLTVFIRLFVEKRLFGSIHGLGNLVYFLLISIPLLAAVGLQPVLLLPSETLLWLGAAVGLTAAASAAMVYGLGRSCQRLGWMAA